MSFAFVFPGQGSQSLHMMDNLKTSKVVENVFGIAKEVLGVDYLSMLDEATPDNINKTIHTQPLMLCSSYATYLAWLGATSKFPKVVAGHSLGEWTALVVAEVISFEDALNLVKLRAKLMQDAVAEGVGAMAVVLGLEDDKIVATCAEVEKEIGGVVAGVNFNSAGQVVIAGDKKAVDVALERFKLLGAKKVQHLAVSVPSHCLLMKPAAEKLVEYIDKILFKEPKIPVIHNVSAMKFEQVADIKFALIKQLYSPVLWSASVKNMVAGGVTQIVECGPGKVLTGLNKRIDGNITSFNLHSMDDIEKVNIALI